MRRLTNLAVLATSLFDTRMPITPEQLSARQAQDLNATPEKRAPARGTVPSLPGASLPRHYIKLAAVSNGKGETILFGHDWGNARLTIWLPVGDGAWTVYEPPLRVQDFDVVGNHLQGRKDDTIDLAVISYDNGRYQASSFQALPFSTKASDWDVYFSKPVDLTPFVTDHNYVHVRLGLLPKAQRSVFLLGLIPTYIGATRCDIDQNKQVTAYPFDLGPEWNNQTADHIFEPCVVARLPGSYTLDDGLVGGYSADLENELDGVVKVMLPKTPLGAAWTLSPLPPLSNVARPQWCTVTSMSNFLRADTGEPIVTFVMSVGTDSPLNKAVWVMDNHTLYHSNEGWWWLAAPTDQVFPPRARSPVRALPVQMQAGGSPTWLWLQIGRNKATPGHFTLLEGRSSSFFNENATTNWLTEATQFDATVGGSPTAPGETLARIFLSLDNDRRPETLSLAVATLDNTSGEWRYQDLPVPPRPSAPGASDAA